MEIVGFYDPKFEYRHGGTTLREHGRAKTKEQTTKQAEKRHEGAVPRGTVVPCGTGWPCYVPFRRLFCLATRVCPGGVSSWRLGFHPKGKNPIFQALYKEGQV